MLSDTLAATLTQLVFVIVKLLFRTFVKVKVTGMIQERVI